MTIEFLWQLPAASDARLADATRYKRGERLPGEPRPYVDEVTDPRGSRFNYFDYLHQIARAAELAGFDGIQVQHDVQADESWIIAGYLARSTRRLRLLAEFEAARGSAVYAAKNAVSYQRFTGNRFAWQLSSGGTEQERRQQGDFLAEDKLLQRIDEFLITAKGVITQSPFSFKGEFFEVLDGGFQGPLANNAVPRIYLSGNTPTAYELSARQADVHLFDGAAVADAQKALAELQILLQQQNRNLSAGIRLDVLARETEEEAVFDARRFWQQSGFGKGGDEQPLAPNLWSLPVAYSGARASLIGSYEQVAQRLIEYIEAGFSSFLLAASPHLEEAYRIGEYVLPLIHKHLAEHPSLAA